MNKLPEYSLSEYFDALEQKQKKLVQRGSQAEGFSATESVLVLKTLKGADDQKLSLTTLARAIRMRLGYCEDIVEHLEDEGLVAIEKDEEKGNDVIALTSKGSDLL